jgi:hypothetical protein
MSVEENYNTNEVLKKKWVSQKNHIEYIIIKSYSR